jgi:DNA adenine methylase
MRYPSSILKSPGSKGWFVLHSEGFVRNQQVTTIVEPFAGSAVVGLTLLDRGYAQRLVLAEKDRELWRFWDVALSDAEFAQRVREWTHKLWAVPPENRHQFAVETAMRMERTDPAFSVLLRSRFAFNGILRGPSVAGTNRLVRNWWPQNLGISLQFLYEARNKIQLFSDAFECLRRTDSPDSYAFVDPPYSVGKNSPGHKLYRASDVNHPALMRLLATWTGSWQLTSEFCPEMLRCLGKATFDPPLFQRYVIPMRPVNGPKKLELVLSRGPIGCEKGPCARD